MGRTATRRTATAQHRLHARETANNIDSAARSRRAHSSNLTVRIRVGEPGSLRRALGSVASARLHRRIVVVVFPRTATTRPATTRTATTRTATTRTATRRTATAQHRLHARETANNIDSAARSQRAHSSNLTV